MSIHSFNQNIADDPTEILISNLRHAVSDNNYKVVDNIIFQLKSLLYNYEPLEFRDAAKWCEEDTKKPNQIIENLLDASDKLAILGSSKTRKSFYTLQLCLCAATGKNFVGLNIHQKRRVAYIQFEISENHLHLRLKRMKQALKIDSSEINGQLLILNARGLRLEGPDGIERIQAALRDFNPELIVFDPLYKIFSGVENDAKDMKSIMASFDSLAKETGAATSYVHHDPKGSPGDRSIQDRGAGSGVISRDYDCCFALTQHASEENAIVIDVLQRNYPPIEPFSIRWSNEDGGYCFRRADDIIPAKKTSRTKSPALPLSSYYPIAKTILENGEMVVKIFKIQFKEKTGLSDKRLGEFMAWAEDPKDPRFLFNEQRGRGKHIKTIRLADLEESLDL